MLEKFYYFFVNCIIYGILIILFVFLIIKTFLKSMFNKFFYSVLNTLDKIKEINMINKIKNSIVHYWTDHKAILLIVAIVIVVTILT